MHRKLGRWLRTSITVTRSNRISALAYLFVESGPA